MMRIWRGVRVGCLEVFFSVGEGEDLVLVLHLRLALLVGVGSDSVSECGEAWFSGDSARVSADSGACAVGEVEEPTRASPGSSI